MTSSTYRDAVFANLEKRNKMQLGENGCLEFSDAGVGSDILALSQVVRGGDVESLVKNILERGSTSEVVQLFVLNFVIRNTRGGKGEKKLSYDIYLVIAQHYPETAKALLPCFVHYGYWKDLPLILERARDLPIYEELMAQALQLMKHQWDKDLAALSVYERQLETAKLKDDQPLVVKLKNAGPKISLLSKWLPRENKLLDKKIKFVERFADLVYPSATTSDASSWKSVAKRKYRRQLALLTSFLALPEVLLAAHRADEIDVQRVASKATKLFSRAFLNEDSRGQMRSEDAKRLKLRDMFLDSIVENGLKGGQVMPHEIVSTIMNNKHISKGMELSLDAQWKSIWKDVVEQVKAKAAVEGLEFDPTQMVPISDVSGSMHGTPMKVAIALGIGISEITHEKFRDLVMTFSEEPQWTRFLKDDTIVDKVRRLQASPWGLSTDFAKSYDLVLKVCEENNLERTEMPCLIVFSDMQFNHACGTNSQPIFDPFSNIQFNHSQLMFDHIHSRVKATAAKLGWEDNNPSPIIFWDLRSTGGHPVNKDTEGTILLSGFSPSLLKLVMNGEALKEEEVEIEKKDGSIVKEKIRVTPEEVLRKMLEDPLYDTVRRILGSSREGALRDYEAIPVSPDTSALGDFEIVPLCNQ
jgi:uncharacterized protein YuzB (UPF0349 family)